MTISPLPRSKINIYIEKIGSSTSLNTYLVVVYKVNDVVELLEVILLVSFQAISFLPD